MTNETVTKEKKETKKDTDFIGNAVTSISNRLLVLETKFTNLEKKLTQVAGRMGL